MSISVAQLVALVKMDGAAAAQAQLLGLGAGFDRTALAAKSFEEMSRMSSASAAQALRGIAPAVASISPAVSVAGSAMATASVQAMTFGDRMGHVVAIGNQLWKIAGIATLVGAAIAVGIGVVAVRAAGDFQQVVNRLRTGAGDTTDSFATLSSGILKVSVATGQLSGPLAAAMYQILSAGQRGALAFSTLTAAAKGAVIEQASVVDVAKTLSTVMTDYGTKTFSASQFMNGLITTVAHGKITLQELSTAMGPILPIAKNLGISFSDLAAAMATQTNAGIPADRAATGLRFTMQALENPTKKAIDAMKALGLNSVDVGNELKKSLPGALQMIYDAALKAGPAGSVPFNRAMADMSGGIRSLTTVAGLTGPHMKDFANNAALVASSMRTGKGDVQGWALALTNLNVVLSRGHAAIDALLIGMGQQLLPAITQIASAVIPIIVRFTQWVIQSHAVENVMHVLVAAITGVINVTSTVVGWLQKHELAMVGLKAILIVVAGLIAGAMVAAMYAYISAAIVAAAATLAWAWPFLLIGALVALVVAGIILAITHWGQIMTWAGGIFSWLGSHIHAILSDIGSFVGGIFSKIGSSIHDKLTSAKNDVGAIFNFIGTTIHVALLAAATFVFQKLLDIENFFKGLPGKIGAALSTLGAILVAPFLWLYNHNYYVKAFVDTAIRGFTDLKNFVGAVFSQIGTTISNFLTWLKNSVGAAFNWVGTTIHDKLTGTKNDTGAIFSVIGTAIRNKLTEVKNDVGADFSWIGSTIHSKLTGAKNDAGAIFSAMGGVVQGKVTDLKNAVGSSFAAMGTEMHSILVGAWNGLVSFASGWPSAAFNWGVNLVQGLISGLASMLGALANMAGQVAGAIASALGFHHGSLIPPKEGPAKDADRWMPALIDGMTEQLAGGGSKMKAALNSLISPLSAQLSVSANASLGGLGGLSSLGSPGLSAAYARVAVTGSGQTIVINYQPPPIILDGVRVSQQLMPHIANRFRYGAGISL